MSADLTFTQQQGQLFAVLSAHLGAHPELQPVRVDVDGEIRVLTDRDGRVAAGQLAAWMRSVGATDLHARLNPEGVTHDRRGYAAVWTGPLTWGPVPDLWGTVRDLDGLLAGRPTDPDDWRGRVRMTLAELEYFAAHGTLTTSDEACGG